MNEIEIDLPSRYKFLDNLGRGSMGLVLLVRDVYLGRDVAFKLLHISGAWSAHLEQLKEEFAVLAGIEHPGIARAYDFGYLGERPYFTREYVPGAPLSAAGKRMEPAEFLSVARDLAEAMAFLHQGKFLHLDIKPSNIILPGPETGRQRPVLIDFGLCRRYIEAGQPSPRYQRGPPRRRNGSSVAP